MITSNEAATPPAKPRRHWFQFGLRTLLVLMTLCGFACGWLGMRVQRVLDQRSAVDALQAAGARMVFVDPVSFASRNSWLLSLFGAEALYNVSEIDIINPEFGNHELAHVSRLTQLKSLKIGSTQVTDEGVTHLRGLTQLSMLYLDGTQVTDEGLGHLHGLTQLGCLTLKGTQVSDEGVAKLKQTLPHIQGVE